MQAIMRFGAPLTFSALGHVAVAAMTVVALPYIDEQYEQAEIIPVDVIIGDVPEWSPPPGGETAPPQPSLKPPRPPSDEPEEPAPDAGDAEERIEATTTDDAPLESVDPLVSSTTAVDEPAEPEPVEAVPDTPPEPEEAEEPQEDLGPPPEPRMKPPPPSQSRLDSLRDLLDERNSAAPPAREPTFTPRPIPTPDRRRGGDGDNIAAYKQVIQAQMAGCWRTSIDAPDPEKLVVEVRIELGRDGRLVTSPEVLNSNRIRLSGDPFWEAARLRAVNGVIGCEPFPAPPEPFDENRFIELVFRPTL